MKKFLPILMVVIISISLSGCGNNFSPRSPKINNPNGTIEELKNNQNGVMSEIDLLKNQQEIQNSELEKIQQGLLNLQNIYENSGIQVFSGPGGLMTAIVGFVCLTILSVHYRSQAKNYEKTANLLTSAIVNSNDPDLEEHVYESALGSNLEEKILGLVEKHKSMR